MIRLPETLWQTDPSLEAEPAPGCRCLYVLDTSRDRSEKRSGAGEIVRVAFPPSLEATIRQALDSPQLRLGATPPEGADQERAAAEGEAGSKPGAWPTLHFYEPAPPGAGDREAEPRLRLRAGAVRLERQGRISTDRRTIRVPTGNPGLIYSFLVGFLSRLELDRPAERGIPVHGACFGIGRRQLAIVGTHGSGKTSALVSTLRMAHARGLETSYTSDDWCTLRAVDGPDGAATEAAWASPWIRLAPREVASVDALEAGDRSRLPEARCKQNVDLGAALDFVRYQPRAEVGTVLVVDAIDRRGPCRPAELDDAVEQILLYSSHLPMDRANAEFDALRGRLCAALDGLEVLRIGQDAWRQGRDPLLAELLLPDGAADHRDRRDRPRRPAGRRPSEARHGLARQGSAQ